MDMDTIELGPYVIEFDQALTARAYEGIETPGPEQCGCWYCRNWVAGRADLVPQGIREILGRFGIPLAGEIEVWEVPGDGVPHIYGGWYLFVGRLVSVPSDSSEGMVVDGWQLTFSEDQPYQVEAFRSFPTCQLDFVAPSSGDFIEPIADTRPKAKR